MVSPPETDEAWSTRIVLGERVWIEEGILSPTESLGLVAAGGAVHLWTLRAAAKRRALQTVVGAVVSVALMLLFCDQMVRLYEDYETGRPDTDRCRLLPANVDPGVDSDR